MRADLITYAAVPVEDTPPRDGTGTPHDTAAANTPTDAISCHSGPGRANKHLGDHRFRRARPHGRNSEPRAHDT